MKWPKVTEVAHELEIINSNIEGHRWISLEIDEDNNNSWRINTDLSASDFYLPGVVGGDVLNFNSRKVASGLLHLAKARHLR